MKHKLLLGLVLINLLEAGTMTLVGKIEVASVVGFDQAEITSSSYNTGVNTFKQISINNTLSSGVYFEVLKNIYAKSNSSADLEMQLDSSNFGGQLQSAGGNAISMAYHVNGTKMTLATTWVTIPTTQNTVTTLTNGFQAKSKNAIPVSQPAGDYSVVLEVSIRAKL